MKSVYSAKRDIQFNTTLRKEEFSYGLKDVTKLRGKFFTNDEEFENFRTKSSIKKDEVLILDLIEKIPAVKSGDKLILEVKKGSVEIHVEAVARQNGKIGELIDVLTANNELIRAKVISPNKVLVE
jgi:flagella basal body P-ring formation protein FlgA